MHSLEANAGKLRRTASVVTLVLATSLAAGCAKNNAGTPLSTASTAPVTREAALAEAQALNAAYKKDPDNTALAIRFAESLDAIGSKKESVAVLASTAERHADNKEIMAAYGKSLLGAGRVEESIDILKRASAIDQRDWRTLSALGMAHDQSRLHPEARKYYAAAARLAPSEPSIQNNIGLSYALDKDLASSEAALRKALKMKGAEPRVRQNLALVLGLQGKFADAEKVARMDLPEAEAEQNIAYLREMLVEPNAWSQIASMESRRQKRPANGAAAKPATPVMAGVPARKPAKLAGAHSEQNTATADLPAILSSTRK